MKTNACNEYKKSRPEKQAVGLRPLGDVHVGRRVPVWRLPRGGLPRARPLEGDWGRLPAGPGRPSEGTTRRAGLGLTIASRCGAVRERQQNAHPGWGSCQARGPWARRGRRPCQGGGCGASAPRVFSLHLVTCGHDFPSGAARARARARHLMGTNLQVLTEPGGESGTRPFAPRWLSVWEGVHARRTPGSQLEFVWDLFWTMPSAKWSLYHVLKKLLSAQWLPRVPGLRLCRLSRPELDPHSFQDRIFLNLSVCWQHNPPISTGFLFLFCFALSCTFPRRKMSFFQVPAQRNELTQALITVSQNLLPMTDPRWGRTGVPH